MIINTDSYFKMGSSHKVCEDYALSGYSLIPYVILSDGCSSARHTDIGARILCHLAQSFLSQKEICQTDKISSHLIQSAKKVIDLLGLPVYSLYATLVILYEQNGLVKVILFGDGLVITVKRDQKIVIHNVSFDNNAPDYMAYQLDEKIKSFYLASSTKKWVTVNDGHPIKYEHELLQPVVMEFPVSDYETIAISSDGLNSFIPQEKLSEIEIAHKFITFKNFQGEFVKRRAAKAVKDLEKEGIIHSDDLSIGAIHIKQTGV